MATPEPSTPSDAEPDNTNDGTEAFNAVAGTTTDDTAASLSTRNVNDADEVIYLKLGAAAVLNAGIRLNANGGSYEMSLAAGNLYVGAVNGICASGGKKLLVTEGV